MSRRAGTSRRIVVDACLARAAGGKTATHPRSKACRDCLAAIYDICHRAVMDDAIREEWERESSRFARRWFARMKSKRKLVFLGEPGSDAGRGIRARLLEKKPTVADDACLAESALLTDRAILSTDCAAREAVAEHCADTEGVSDIMWVCPEHHEGVVDWLEEGAPDRAEWTLGSAAHPS